MSIYDLAVNDITGKEVKLDEYKGKVILVVNTASKCGFTPQYEGLENLYEKYKDQDFVVLGFPCNQFGKQEPGDESEIQEFCRASFSIKFPMFQKIEVNGQNEHPLYTHLKEKAPGVLGSKKIKWNFTKFMISKDGEKIERYAPTTKPESLEEDIQKLLKE
jgi:glutathione peroxidase